MRDIHLKSILGQKYCILYTEIGDVTLSNTVLKRLVEVVYVNVMLDNVQVIVPAEEWNMP